MARLTKTEIEKVVVHPKIPVDTKAKLIELAGSERYLGAFLTVVVDALHARPDLRQEILPARLGRDCAYV